DSMSWLPPLKAAMTLAPATCPLACGLFRSSVNSGTWEVSQPMMPIRNSEAVAADQPNKPGSRNSASFIKQVLTQRRKDLKAQRRKRNLISEKTGALQKLRLCQDALRASRQRPGVRLSLCRFGFQLTP